MTDVIFGAVLVLCCGAVWALWVTLSRVLRQQGRLLARIEELEADSTAVAPGTAQQRTPVEVGSPFPAFSLPDLHGAQMTLGDISARRIVFVHWDPACGFCEQIASTLTGLQQDLAHHDTELVLVSHGSAESVARWAAGADVKGRILLQSDARMAAFEGTGTPVAYLVDERRRVAAAAVGADEVAELARQAARGRRVLATERPLSQSKIQRDGLRPGVPAPDFTLPDLDGNYVALADFRGSRVLLVFSDASCSPCDEAVAGLVELAGGGDADTMPAVVMVSRGDEAVNRRKVAQHGVPFPVVLQQGWRLSREYGIFATPVAFLIGEDGRTAAPVATGPDEVLALARSAARSMSAESERPATLPIVFSEGRAK